MCAAVRRARKGPALRHGSSWWRAQRPRAVHLAGGRRLCGGAAGEEHNHDSNGAEGNGGGGGGGSGDGVDGDGNGGGGSGGGDVEGNGDAVGGGGAQAAMAALGAGRGRSGAVTEALRRSAKLAAASAQGAQLAALAGVACAVAEEPVVLPLDTGGELLVFIREVELS
jgi:hypothetical protein